MVRNEALHESLLYRESMSTHLYQHPLQPECAPVTHSASPLYYRITDYKYPDVPTLLMDAARCTFYHVYDDDEQPSFAG
jgi:hypothetical protein